MFKAKEFKIAASQKRIDVTSSPKAARGILEQLMVQLKVLSLSDECAGKIELVVAEAINNIVEHAYPPGAPDGPIQLSWSFEDNRLNFAITDQGLGMPDGKAPSGRAKSVKVDLMDLPEGGFGWFLIRDQAENVEYRRTGWENCLSFGVPVNLGAI